VLPKLKRLLTDGNSSIHEIVQLVRLDPGIAARVLQVGNSAYFSHGLRCYTVDEAVQRVGYDQIYELVATAVATQVLVRPLEAYDLEADQLWFSSIAGAIAAECLAERANVDRDIAYTIGLLHRVGMVAINECVVRSMPGIRLADAGLPLETCVAERQLLGFHNGEVGAALLRLWEFPAVMSEPLRWQYLPSATAAHSQLATLLALAKWVRSAAMLQDVPAPPDPVQMRKLGLSASLLDRVVTTVRHRLGEVSTLLGSEHDSTMRLRFPNGERLVDAVSTR
jgi:HD-like signal output (HDOD) protein